MTGGNDLGSRLRHILGAEGYLTDAATRLIYARDASHLTLGSPLGVALPATVEQLRQVVAACAAAEVPVVARGSGTGLSGGAVPPDGALVLGTARLTGLGTVNAGWGCVQAEPGVLNETVSTHAAPAGDHFAPDPSSQSAATIGGNIAANAGGPHCLRHGVTLQHLRRLQWVGADGTTHVTGRGVSGERGFDLVSLLCGSEGTLGVVTTADLRLVPNASAVVTLLAFFPALDDATGAVVRLLGQGLLPVAVEMVDQSMLRAVEEAFSFGFPTDVEAAMIVEFSGVAEEIAEDSDRTATLLREAGAREVRRAADDAERSELWKCRKKAFGAVGRLAPRYVTMDVVVPLGQLPGLVRQIQEIKTRHEVAVATTFHAGDGNLHPGVHYDDQDPEATRRAHAAADEIIAAALARGGSATGEHGVGIEKLHVLPWQIDAVTADLYRKIKRVFDPRNLLNPGKLLPDPAADYAAIKPLPAALNVQWDCLTVTAPAETRLSEIQAQVLARGLWLPVGIPGSGTAYGVQYDPTVGELLDHLNCGPALFAAGTARDFLLESWAETGGGEVFHSGAPVFKNVAGYGLHHALCGSGGVFVRHLAATFALRPRPERALIMHLDPGGKAGLDLDPLRNWLADTRGGVAESQVVVDPDEGVFVIVAGRDRPWDLGRVAAGLSARFGPAGWCVTTRREVPFAETASLLTAGHLPAWLLGAPQWTSLAPLPTNRIRVGLAAGTRHLRQARSGRCWVPGSAPDLPGWRAEPFIANGRVLPLPAPAAGVPVALLRGLKTLFDPGGKWPTPTWLVAEAAEHE